MRCRKNSKPRKRKSVLAEFVNFICGDYKIVKNQIELLNADNIKTSETA